MRGQDGRWRRSLVVKNERWGAGLGEAQPFHTTDGEAGGVNEMRG